MYQINDGVKRAKAAQLAGHTEVLTKVFEDYEESKVLCERRVRLDALLSPRTSFPVHNRPDFPDFGPPLEDRANRWKRIREAAEGPELPFPPIRVFSLVGERLAIAEHSCMKIEDVQLEE